MLCVDVDASGFLVNTGIPASDCLTFILMTPVEADKLTYWADLSIQLDPSQPLLWALMGSMLATYTLIWGLKYLRNLLNREE